jgi:aminoglycoside phosphotransferase (APT) family kinase protein
VATSRMHANEREIDVGLVTRLIGSQFPQWAGLPLRAVTSSGTDNALFRLGDEIVVRLPRIDWAVGGAEVEREWPPRFAPQLPVDVPLPLGRGLPGHGYPWEWSVFTWLDGATPTIAGVARGDVDADVLARDLAAFILALQRVDAADGPRAGRGVPLATRDAATRAAIAALAATPEAIDLDAVVVAWEAALAVPQWQGPARWLHADLTPGNLLLTDGRLSAVIDWGASGVGDPACDLIVAWNLLPAQVRTTFRVALDVDDATWARGRGWALSIALIALPYYRETNATVAENSRHVINEVIRDPGLLPT